jgi:hypothetical protein
MSYCIGWQSPRTGRASTHTVQNETDTLLSVRLETHAEVPELPHFLKSMLNPDGFHTIPISPAFSSTIFSILT